MRHDLTLVVCTHDRPDDLERCLASLTALTDDVAVVVVDSASDPPCRDLVERFSGALCVRYLHESEPGLSRARNRGLAEADTELIAFIDDDAMPQPDWARRIAEPFADPEIACVGGACLASFRGARPRWLSERLLQFAGITRIGNEARDAKSSSEWPFGANICFRRSSLLDVGGFDPALGRTGASLLSGEESAVIARLVAAGFRIRLEPKAVVAHTVSEARLESRYYWRRLWWSGITRARANRSPVTGIKLLAASPVRLLLYFTTWDRIYLYRLAETAGYMWERAAQAAGGRR
jgi:GT2 family glycosyltransferase